MLSEKPADSRAEVDVPVDTYESNGEVASTGQNRTRLGDSMFAGPLESREHAEMGEEGARVERPTKNVSDESGPWAFAQAAADSVAGGGAGKVIFHFSVCRC